MSAVTTPREEIDIESVVGKRGSAVGKEEQEIEAKEMDNTYPEEVNDKKFPPSREITPDPRTSSVQRNRIGILSLQVENEDDNVFKKEHLQERSRSPRNKHLFSSEIDDVIYDDERGEKNMKPKKNAKIVKIDTNSKYLGFKLFKKIFGNDVIIYVPIKII